MDTPALYSGFDDPKTQGILAMAAALLQSGGASRYPQGLAPLGAGLQAGLSQMNLAKKQQADAQQEAMKAALLREQAAKVRAEVQRQRQRSAIMNAPIASGASVGGPWSPQYAAANPAQAPWVALETRGQQLIDADFIDDGKKLIETAKILKDRLEMRYGVWYDKFTGKPVVGGHSVNQQGFGSLFNVGTDGSIGMAPLPGSDARFATQQGIIEQEKAKRDLIRVDPTNPNAPPTYRSRESLLNPTPPGPNPSPSPAPAPQAAGMSPAAKAAQEAAAAQGLDIAKFYGKTYTDLQNASMSNPGKIAKFRQIGDLLGDFEGGKLSPTGLQLASAANSLNIKIDKKLGNKQAAEALSSEIALELRSTGQGGGMPGAMSDADREFLKGMTPNMAQSADGRKRIIEARTKMLEREMVVAKMAAKYRKKHNVIDDGFVTQLQEWSNRNPIFQ